MTDLVEHGRSEITFALLLIVRLRFWMWMDHSMTAFAKGYAPLERGLRGDLFDYNQAISQAIRLPPTIQPAFSHKPWSRSVNAATVACCGVVAGARFEPAEYKLLAFILVQSWPNQKIKVYNFR